MRDVDLDRAFIPIGRNYVVDVYLLKTFLLPILLLAFVGFGGFIVSSFRGVPLSLLFKSFFWTAELLWVAFLLFNHFIYNKRGDSL